VLITGDRFARQPVQIVVGVGDGATTQLSYGCAIARRPKRVRITRELRSRGIYSHRGETIERVVRIAGRHSVRILIALQIANRVVGIVAYSAIQRNQIVIFD